jgi:hypothetical protein
MNKEISALYLTLIFSKLQFGCPAAQNRGHQRMEQGYLSIHFHSRKQHYLQRKISHSKIMLNIVNVVQVDSPIPKECMMQYI